VSYLAILPMPATDLGRDAEIEIAAGRRGKAPPTDAMVAPALTISMFNLRSRDRPIAPARPQRRCTRTYGGFVLELGDAEQHGSFEAFVRHIDAHQLTATWHEGAACSTSLQQRRRPDGSRLHHRVRPADETHFAIDPGQQERAIPCGG
jgi:hypothetical protein